MNVPAATLIFLCFLSLPLACPGQYTISVNDDGVTCTITGYSGPGGVVNIPYQLNFPYTLNYFPVTAIGDGAFQNASNVTSIMFPPYENNITSIGNYAFRNCTKLSSIDMGFAVQSIGYNAFAHCTNLTSIIFPPSFSSMGIAAFYNCPNLASAYFLGNAPSGYQGEFANDSTTIYYFPGTTGWSSPFWGTTAVLDTNQGTFSWTTNADGMVTITGCSDAIGILNIPGILNGRGVTGIGPRAFWGSLNEVTSMNIPFDITNIGDFAFAADDFFPNTSLTSVTIPGSVTTMGEYVFYECNGLTNVFFGGNPPSLGGWVFSYDPNVIFYYLPGTVGWTTYAQMNNASAVLWNPSLQGAAVSNGQFGFNITGTSNITVVVGACTNLASPVWVPLQSFVLTNGSVYFSDTNSASFPTRYYGIGFP